MGGEGRGAGEREWMGGEGSREDVRWDEMG